MDLGLWLADHAGRCSRFYKPVFGEIWEELSRFAISYLELEYH